MKPAPISAQAGFTLIEVLIAVSLFALIGMAGFAVVQSIINVQLRTESRLEQLGERQRAMHLLTADFEQLRAGSLTSDGPTLSLRRASEAAGRDIAVSYDLTDGTLRRVLDPGGGKRPQTLLRGIGAVVWQFYLPATGWTKTLGAAGDGDAPAAIAVELSLAEDPAGRNGVLRRVIFLPQPIKK